MIGTTLAHFKITAKLGEGGMGEVYRAEDTKLGREVAIKVLPEEFASDSERLARFEREAKLLASLNHPNIAAVYEVDLVGETQFLVMEFVDGETLQERLSRGPLSVEQALKIAIQLATGLESAHNAGIIHRDLKPANIKITPTGEVLILDFGVGKAMQPTGSEVETQAPTLTAFTIPGALIGTPAYMSPEQVTGRPTDRQIDIWAFGCVLYEMLTDQQPFKADTPNESLAAIVHLKPDWERLPGKLHPTARILLRRCLRKDPSERLRDIGDARMDLEEVLQHGRSERRTVARGFRRQQLLGWGVAGLLAIGLLLLLVARWQQPPADTVKSSIRLAAPFVDRGRPSAVLSPDGTHLAYVGQTDNGPLIHIRPLDQFEARPLAGTEEAQSLFFSPDGQTIGFWASQKIKKISIKGGPPSVICETAEFSGATWSSDDSIVFGGAGPLYRVSADGGEPGPITLLEPDKGESTHDYPQFLPGESEILFASSSGGPGESTIAVHSLDGGEKHIILEGGTFPRYAETGHLFFTRSDTVFAVAFDPETLSVAGPQVPILEDVAATPGFGMAQYSFASNGTMVYVPGGGANGRTLAWIDRAGATRELLGVRRQYYMPRISPDGSRIAVTILQEGNYDIWLMDPARGALTPFTAEGSNTGPVWSPEGRRIAFASKTVDSEKSGIFIWQAEGAGSGRQLTSTEGIQVPTSWSPDGETLLFTEILPSGSEDVFALSLDGSSTVTPIADSKFNESGGVFSPDGKWIAYSSMESGRYQIYVQPFPGPGARVTVSGGEPAFMPVWSRASNLRLSAPEQLFEQQFGGSIGMALSRYDVSEDGESFVFATPEKDWAPTQIHVIQNWLGEVERHVPSKR
jgi:Tol biopolymer transport system component/predicted Ser/Thr protein kinase